MTFSSTLGNSHPVKSGSIWNNISWTLHLITSNTKILICCLYFFFKLNRESENQFHHARRGLQCFGQDGESTESGQFDAFRIVIKICRRTLFINVRKREYFSSAFFEWLIIDFFALVSCSISTFGCGFDLRNKYFIYVKK